VLLVDGRGERERARLALVRRPHASRREGIEYGQQAAVPHGEVSRRPGQCVQILTTRRSNHEAHEYEDERPLGRRILALLDLLDSQLHRRDLMAFLSDGWLPKSTRERSASTQPAAPIPTACT
jgi:hypothetical protein